MTAPVMGDDAIAMIQKEHHLRVPVIRAEWPAMTKNDRLSRTPVLVIDFSAVLGFDPVAMRLLPFWFGEVLALALRL